MEITFRHFKPKDVDFQGKRRQMFRRKLKILQHVLKLIIIPLDLILL